MAEIPLLDKLLIIDEWLQEQIEIYEAAFEAAQWLPDTPYARRLEVITDTFKYQHCVVRSQLEALNEYETREAIAKQESKN